MANIKKKQDSEEHSENAASGVVGPNVGPVPHWQQPPMAWGGPRQVPGSQERVNHYPRIQMPMPQFYYPPPSIPPILCPPRIRPFYEQSQLFPPRYPIYSHQPVTKVADITRSDPWDVSGLGFPLDSIFQPAVAETIARCPPDVATLLAQKAENRYQKKSDNDSDDSGATVIIQFHAAGFARPRNQLYKLIPRIVSDTSNPMASSHGFKNGAMESRGLASGPDLGTIKVGHQYICECRISRMFAERRLDPAREANYRLQGIQVIQSTREALFLPIKTYNTACTLYHRFRLDHPTPDYNYTDAALASLFVACKIEDTLKKSREIICAHHNLKNPDHPTTQDDKIFDQPSKVLIGIERFMVEAINFDFRVRYPQKIIAKIVKKVLAPSADISDFITTSLKISIDLYMTYAPLKHSSYTCAFVIAQLTTLITNQFHGEFGSMNPLDWHTDEQCVAEVMLDLLDLYTQHGKATKVGPGLDLQVFIDIQIKINQYCERAGLSRYVNQCRECQSTIPPPTPSSDSPMSFNTPSASGTSTIKRGLKGADGGTTRFIFDADEAVRERTTYNEYNMDEFEEWEEETEEPIPDAREDRRHEPRGPRGPRGHGRGHGRGGFDPGWTPRNRHDRRRRGGGGGFY